MYDFLENGELGYILQISDTGCKLPFTGFQANSGNTSDLADSGCTGFLFSGGKYINTKISGGELTIDFTRDFLADGCSGLSVEDNGTGIIYSLDASGVGDCFNFSGSGCGLSVDHVGENVTYAIDISGLGDCFNFFR